MPARVKHVANASSKGAASFFYSFRLGGNTTCPFSSPTKAIRDPNEGPVDTKALRDGAIRSRFEKVAVSAD